ncbi:hypothetical protein [Carboxylicivirga sp. M1479]|uniref:hypothetical protein n=1 Tax=Carboxylicivirga sp. M1479 TaxID=2594476 RepID=UPI001177ECDC|nr:hypothetical protein [Carboxylicivirga sp. M1479]TRX72406.1 hypothetical protein FNN09_00255 [Carboxylicivirga sp. M1479]
MNSRIYIALLLIGLCACTGLDVDKISENFEYTPDFSLPIGKLTVQYDDVNDLPIDLPDPIDSEPVNWSETDTAYFNSSESVAERKYILSMMIQFDITNRYPAYMDAELYLIDAMGNDIYLTSSPIILEPAEINADGEVVKERHTQPYPYQMPLSDEMIDALLTSTQIVIKASIKELLFTDEVVNQFPNYQVDMAVGVQAEVDFSINNN